MLQKSSQFRRYKTSRNKSTTDKKRSKKVIFSMVLISYGKNDILKTTLTLDKAENKSIWTKKKFLIKGTKKETSFKRTKDEKRWYATLVKECSKNVKTDRVTNVRYWKLKEKRRVLTRKRQKSWRGKKVWETIQNYLIKIVVNFHNKRQF